MVVRQPYRHHRRKFELLKQRRPFWRTVCLPSVATKARPRLFRVDELAAVLKPLKKPLLLKRKSAAWFAVWRVTAKRVSKLLKPYPYRLLASRGSRLYQPYCARQKQGLYARKTEKLFRAMRRLRRLTRVTSQVRRPLLPKPRQLVRK